MQPLLPALLALAAAPAAAQTVHHVDTAGVCGGLSPCHTTITAALATAAPGDTVSVFPGRYDEEVRIVGHRGTTVIGRTRARTDELVCRAESTPDAVELTAELFIDQSEGVRVENLTLRGGAMVFRGSGGPDEPVSRFIGNRVVGRFFLQMCNGWYIRHNVFDGMLEVDTDADCAIVDNAFRRDGIRFSSVGNSRDTVIVGNVLTAGSIAIHSELLRDVRIAQNRLFAGDLVVDGRDLWATRVEGNVLNAGGLVFAAGTGAHNRVAQNRVFGSDGDGIHVELQDVGPNNEATGNTSRDHAGCDINDTSMQAGEHHVAWSGNAFDTACGAADG